MARWFRSTFATWLKALVLACSAADLALAQAPAYVGQWGTNGSGPGQFVSPTGIAVDPSGFVYVTDRFPSRVQKFTGSGAFVAQWSMSSTFPGPVGIASDSQGNLYVTEPGNNVVRKLTGAGVSLGAWGLVGPGLRPSAPEVTKPDEVAVDENDNVYVTDGLGQRVQKFTSTGTFIAQWSSGPFGSLDQPEGIACDRAGSVFIADRTGHRVLRFAEDGTFLGEWQGSHFAPFGTNDLGGVACDAGGHVYVTELNSFDRVQMFQSDGTFLALWGGFGSGPGQFDEPVAAATDAFGTLYVVDQGHFRVERFSAGVTATHSTSWGRLKALYRH